MCIQLYQLYATTSNTDLHDLLTKSSQIGRISLGRGDFGHVSANGNRDVKFDFNHALKLRQSEATNQELRSVLPVQSFTLSTHSARRL